MLIGVSTHFFQTLEPKKPPHYTITSDFELFETTSTDPRCT